MVGRVARQSRGADQQIRKLVTLVLFQELSTGYDPALRVGRMCVLRDLHNLDSPCSSVENHNTPFRFPKMLCKHFDELLVRFTFYRRRGNAHNEVVRVDLLDFILVGVGFHLHTNLHNFLTFQHAHSTSFPANFFNASRYNSDVFSITESDIVGPGGCLLKLIERR